MHYPGLPMFRDWPTSPLYGRSPSPRRLKFLCTANFVLGVLQMLGALLSFVEDGVTWRLWGRVGLALLFTVQGVLVLRRLRSSDLGG